MSSRQALGNAIWGALFVLWGLGGGLGFEDDEEESACFGNGAFAGEWKWGEVKEGEFFVGGFGLGRRKEGGTYRGCGCCWRLGVGDGAFWWVEEGC